MQDSNLKFAVLIDSDNFSHNFVNELFLEVAKYGTPFVKRAYSDWSIPARNPWKGVLLDKGITPIMQFSYTSRKNATDSAMIIDAMDILYNNTVNAFCIASSDSDFTRLAMRIRETGRFVLGIGEDKTPKPFRQACDKFVILGVVPDSPSEDSNSVNKYRDDQQNVGAASGASDSPKGSGTLITEVELKELVAKLNSDEDGWIPLSHVGLVISRTHPDFDVKQYGCRTLKCLFEKMTDSFEVKMRLTESSDKHPYVRLKA